MTAVQTVTGPVAHEALGATLAHEHLIVQPPGLEQQYPWLYNGTAVLERLVAELGEARAAGIGTIVDVTTPDLGRDVALLAAASAASGVRIVAAPGIWVAAGRWFAAATAEQIAGVFTRELEQGIASTSIRAGVIKVAQNRPPGVDALAERVLRGAALAAARTGVPITTHTSPYDVGREQLRVFRDAGVPMQLVAIGHAFTGDLDYLREVLAAGCYLSVDSFRWRAAEAAPVEQALAALCAEGHAARIMLSHDHAAAHLQPFLDPARRSPTWFAEVPTAVRARLAALGVPASDLDAMLLTAPAAFLAGTRAK